MLKAKKASENLTNVLNIDIDIIKNDPDTVEGKLKQFLGLKSKFQILKIIYCKKKSIFLL
jgi:hypothetical protein